MFGVDVPTEDSLESEHDPEPHEILACRFPASQMVQPQLLSCCVTSASRALIARFPPQYLLAIASQCCLGKSVRQLSEVLSRCPSICMLNYDVGQGRKRCALVAFIYHHAGCPPLRALWSSDRLQCHHNPSGMRYWMDRFYLVLL